MKNLKILENAFKEGMKNKDFEEFKKTHPTLLSVILKSMDEKRKETIDEVIIMVSNQREYNYLNNELKQLKSKL